MTIQLIDGFDMYNGVVANTGVLSKWTLNGASGNVSLPAGRFGGQATQHSANNQGNGCGLYRNFASFGPNFTIGIAARITTTPTYTGRAPCCQVAFSGGGQIGIEWNASGGINVVRYSSAPTSSPVGTVLGSTAAGLITLNTWFYLEFSVTLSTTVGAVNLVMNGANVLSLTGQNTQNAASALIDEVFIGLPGINAPCGVYQFDDFYLLDTLTSLGERRVETLRPASDSSVQFTPKSGATNFSQVDETLVDGDTTYVSSSTVGQRDLYTIGSLSSTPATIDAVQVSSFAEKTDATTRQIANSVQSNLTDSDGTAFNLAATYGKFERILQTDPHTSAAWTASGVNNLLIGPKLAA